MSKIKVLIFHHMKITRILLKLYLDKSEDFKCVFDADNTEDVLKLVKEHNPDIIIMDIAFPGRDGHQATQEIMSVYPKSKIIMLTARNNSEDIQKAIDNNVMAYIQEGVATVEELLFVLKKIYNNEQLKNKYIIEN